MNCREFRQKHDSYIDDTLRGADIEGMHLHLRFCEQCSRHDTRIRRALIVARNTPMIDVSADFGARLQARLREENRNGRTIRAVKHDDIRSFSPGAYIVIATGVLVITGLVGIAMLPGNQPAVRMAPVIATAPAHTPMPATTTIVATIPDGIQAWPAAYAPEQGQWHLAIDERSR